MSNSTSRTPAQQAAYERMMGTAETVREQMDAGIIADDYSYDAEMAERAAIQADAENERDGYRG